MSGLQAGWLPDPTGRHEYRWWDGSGWSDVVADGGVERSDPLASAHRAHQAQPHHQQSQQHEHQHQRHLGGHLQVDSATAPRHAAGNGADRSNRQTYMVMGILAIPLVLLLVALAVVVGNNGGDDDDGGGGTDQVAAVSPREALITIDDMPTGWEASDVGGAPGENKVCEPRLEAPEPPREIEASFDRSQPSGALGHTIIETTPDFAADFVDDAQRQANTCGTFTEEYTAGGETYSFTATSEVVTGPTFGDQTVWYVIHTEYAEPAPSSHDVVVCLDRHGGVISEVVLSTSPPPMRDEDRALVEDLIRTASERLQGGTPD